MTGYVMGRIKGRLAAALVGLPLLAGCGEPPVAVEKGPAPDFTIKTFGGGEFKLSDHRGGPVAVNFFASWCLACGAEAADIETVHKEYASRNVAFVGVAVKDTEEKAKGFAEKNGYTFPAGLDREGGIERIYGIRGMPVTVIIDGEGVIDRIRIGGVTAAMLRHDLEKVL